MSLEKRRFMNGRDKEWLAKRKAQKSKENRSKCEIEKPNFVERQVENRVEDLLVKTAFSAIL